VLPNPESRIGSVLIAGIAIERLKTPDSYLAPLLDSLGEAPDAQYLADARWPEVLLTAGLASLPWS
jgi:hypothetical protein